jgi:hypothetical protein
MTVLWYKGPLIPQMGKKRHTKLTYTHTIYYAMLKSVSIYSTRSYYLYNGAVL